MSVDLKDVEKHMHMPDPDITMKNYILVAQLESFMLSLKSYLYHIWRLCRISVYLLIVHFNVPGNWEFVQV